MKIQSVWNNIIENSSKKVIEVFDDSNIDKDFVKSTRKTLGLSQKAFSRVMGVSIKTVEKWEQGSNPVNDSSKRLVYLLSKRPELAQELYAEYKLEGNTIKNEKYIQEEKYWENLNYVPVLVHTNKLPTSSAANISRLCGFSEIYEVKKNDILCEISKSKENNQWTKSQPLAS